MTPCPRCNSIMELYSSMVHRCENPDCEPDPWELLRELCAGAHEVTPQRYWDALDAARKALKQHDAERKSDGK